ncbi:glucose-1-phosphate thymidylyltransferase [Candidatus Bipolaricaulota bacterium]
MKALILCGGESTRMRPLSYSQPKHLIPIANVPVLDRILAGILAVGITEISVVVSPSTQARFDGFLANRKSDGQRIQTVVQHTPRGLADAVRCGRDFLGNEDFLLYLGDNLLQESLDNLIVAFKQAPCSAALSLIEVDDPRRFGVADIGDGRIVRLVEKPANPPSQYALAGIYIFSSRIFEGIENIGPSKRGELEITDAIQWLIEQGDSVIPHYLTGWWKDVGQPDDMIEANALLLQDLEGTLSGHVDDQSSLQGVVFVEQGANVVRSTIQGPAMIGAGTEIVDSIIEPNVSIGPSCRIEHCRISGSIVLEGASLESLRMEHSLIGSGCQVVGDSSERIQRLTLGDFSRINAGGTSRS